MQADTAMPTQSAPQYPPTQPTSYAAPAQTAASSGGFDQSAMGGTLPTGNGPSPANAGPDGSPSAGLNPYSVQLPSTPGAPTTGQPYKEAFNRVVDSGVARPIPQPGSTIESDLWNRPGQLRFPTNNPVQQPGMQTSTLGINNNQASSSNSSQLRWKLPRPAPGKRSKRGKS